MWPFANKQKFEEWFSFQLRLKRAPNARRSFQPRLRGFPGREASRLRLVYGEVWHVEPVSTGFSDRAFSHNALKAKATDGKHAKAR